MEFNHYFGQACFFFLVPFAIEDVLLVAVLEDAILVVVEVV